MGSYLVIDVCLMGKMINVGLSSLIFYVLCSTVCLCERNDGRVCTLLRILRVCNLSKSVTECCRRMERLLTDEQESTQIVQTAATVGDAV